MKITRLKLKSLWNSEYTIFINQIIAIVTKYQPATLHLAKAFGELTAFLPELAKIKVQDLRNALSTLLSNLDKERDILYNTIVAQLKTLKKVNLPAISPHVLVLRQFIDIHGDDIADAPYNAETKRLNDMLADYNAKTDVKLAAEALNLNILFDQIGLVNATFSENFMQRTEEESAEEKVDTRAIRADIDKVLIEFYGTFEAYSREYDDLDYATPANELNNLINYYKTQLKARATRRKSGKNVSEEPPIKPEE